MPQLNQLSDVALSQFLWLAIVLGLIYFGIGKSMLPKIQATVDARDKQISDDLDAAQQARDTADAIEEDYRARMDQSRGEAMRLTAAAKQDGSRATEKRLAKADKSVQAKLAKAEERIRASRKAGLAEIEAAAGDLARDITNKVAGVTVDKDAAARAVKAAMAHG